MYVLTVGRNPSNQNGQHLKKFRETSVQNEIGETWFKNED